MKRDIKMKKKKHHCYEVEYITLDNVNKYEDVFYCNNEYYMITEGRVATRSDCIETIEYTIEGISKNKFHNIGFADKGEPVACLFVIEGYPDNATLWIGLFLVHDKYKRKHVGTELIKDLILSLKDTNIKQIRLSVQDNNSSGLSFWKNIGFSIVDKTESESHNNFTMEYVI